MTTSKTKRETRLEKAIDFANQEIEYAVKMIVSLRHLDWGAKRLNYLTEARMNLYVMLDEERGANTDSQILDMFEELEKERRQDAEITRKAAEDKALKALGEEEYSQAKENGDDFTIDEKGKLLR